MGINSSHAVILSAAKNLSRSKRTKNTNGVRWVTAPQGTLAGMSAVQAVALIANEDVQWLWTHTANGSYVSGYNVVRRLTPLAVILSEANNLSRAPRRRGSAPEATHGR